MDMWMDADGVTLTLATADGQPLARDTIEGYYLKTKYGTDDGEIIRMSYQPAPDPDDPDAPTPPRKFVRLVLQELPPPPEYLEAMRHPVTCAARAPFPRPCTCGREASAPIADPGPWSALGPFTQYETEAHGPGGPGL